MPRHLTPMHLIDNFGGSICPEAERKAFQVNGTGAAPINVRYRALTRKHTFANQGLYRISADKQAAALARQAKFTAVSAAVQTAFGTPATLAQYKEDFEKQSKYPTLRGYVFAEEYKKYQG